MITSARDFRYYYLCECDADEYRVGGGVAFEQALWFHREAECPFEACALEPARRLFDGAGMEVEGCADAKHDAWNLVFVRAHPVLLFWAADADKSDVRARIHERACGFAILILGQRTKGGDHRRDDLDVGEPLV